MFYKYVKTTKNINKNNDSYTMCGNPLLPITRKECVPNLLPMSATNTMKNRFYGECKSHIIEESLWEILHDHGLIDTFGQKPKYHWTDDFCSIQTGVNGDNTEIVNNILAKKLEVVHVE